MSAAVTCFALTCKYGFQLPPPLAMAWWTALVASDDRRCTWVARRLQRYTGKAEGYGAWLCRTVPATNLVAAVEVLQEEQRLTRQQATAIQDAILGLMRQGYWK